MITDCKAAMEFSARPRPTEMSCWYVTLRDELKPQALLPCSWWRPWRSRRKSTCACGSTWTRSFCPSWTTIPPYWRSRSSSNSTGMMSVPHPRSPPGIATIIPVVEAEPCKPGRKPTGRREEADSVAEEQKIDINRPITPPAAHEGYKTFYRRRSSRPVHEGWGLFLLCLFYPQPPVVLMLVRLQHLLTLLLFILSKLWTVATVTLFEPPILEEDPVLTGLAVSLYVVHWTNAPLHRCWNNVLDLARVPLCILT